MQRFEQNSINIAEVVFVDIIRCVLYINWTLIELVLIIVGLYLSRLLYLFTEIQNLSSIYLFQARHFGHK